MCDSTISSSQFFLATHLAQQPSSQSRHASISQSHLLYYFVHVTMSRSHSHPWPRCRQKPPPKEQPMKAFATKFPCQIKTFKIVKAWCGFRTQQQLQSWSKQHSWSTLFHEYALVALLFSYASVSSQCRLASNCLDQFSPWKLNICDQDLSAACFRYHWTTDPRKKKTCQAQIKIRYLPSAEDGQETTKLLEENGMFHFQWQNMSRHHMPNGTMKKLRREKTKERQKYLLLRN